VGTFQERSPFQERKNCTLAQVEKWELFSLALDLEKDIEKWELFSLAQVEKCSFSRKKEYWVDS
jgi:hypothetical protein